MILKRFPLLAASLMELQHGIVNKLTLNVLKTEYMLMGSRQITSDSLQKYLIYPQIGSL